MGPLWTLQWVGPLLGYQDFICRGVVHSKVLPQTSIPRWRGQWVLEAGMGQGEVPSRL